MVRLTGNFLNLQYENYITSGADTFDPHLRKCETFRHSLLRSAEMRRLGFLEQVSQLANNCLDVHTIWHLLLLYIGGCSQSIC
jgi:hypothetical protein